MILYNSLRTLFSLFCSVHAFACELSVPKIVEFAVEDSTITKLLPCFDASSVTIVKVSPGRMMQHLVCVPSDCIPLGAGVSTYLQ